MTKGDVAYHFVGIGGIGMSAIARLLLARGLRVSGSDVARTPVVEALERAGARVTIGHRAENVAGAQRVVVSSAIAATNPEHIAARAARCEIVARGTMLAELTLGQRLIAIAGTHGKSTTTAMTAAILETAGYDPTSAVGAIRSDTGSNARAGAGEWFVTEADESDGSFLALRPEIAVVTNVENDHLDSDDEFPRLVGQFATFVGRVPERGRAILGADNPVSAGLARATAVPVTTFASGVAADVVARDIVYEGLGSRFTLEAGGVAQGAVALHVPGEINVQNALAAAAAALAAGVPAAPIRAALGAFRGIARRFEIVAERDGVVVVDDYAHHPTAVARTIAAARGYRDARIVVAFQPHRYTRTRYLAGAFAGALAGADEVLLAPVYAASEDPIPGVSERSIGEPLERAGGPPVHYVAGVEGLLDAIPPLARGRTVVLMLGAGSISGVAHRLGDRLAAAPLTR